MARSLQVENLLPQNVGSIIIDLHHHLLAATGHDVRDGRSNYHAIIRWHDGGAIKVAPPTFMGSTPWAPRA